MDINDIRKIFGNMPIEALPAAQILKQKRSRNLYFGIVAILSAIFGGWVVYKLMKKDEPEKPLEPK